MPCFFYMYTYKINIYLPGFSLAGKIIVGTALRLRYREEFLPFDRKQFISKWSLQTRSFLSGTKSVKFRADWSKWALWQSAEWTTTIRTWNISHTSHTHSHFCSFFSVHINHSEPLGAQSHTHTSGGSIQRRRARRGSWSRCMDVIPRHMNDQENDIRRSCQFNQINQHHLDLSGLAILGRAHYCWGPPVGDLSSRALSLKLIQISWSLVALSVSVHATRPEEKS